MVKVTLAVGAVLVVLAILGPRLAKACTPLGFLPNLPNNIPVSLVAAGPRPHRWSKLRDQFFLYGLKGLVKPSFWRAFLEKEDAPAERKRVEKVNGREGPIYWHVVCGRRQTRFIVFRYKDVRRKYFFYTGGEERALDLLQRFKKEIGYEESTPKVPVNMVGYEGPISWETVWTNDVGKITFYYRAVNDQNQLVVAEKNTYNIKYGSPEEIRSAMSEFQTSINFDQLQNAPAPENGLEYDFFIEKEGEETTMTLMFKEFKDGKEVASVTKDYTLSGQVTSQDINGAFQQFLQYVQDNYKVEEEPPVTGKITWDTKFQGDDVILVAEFKEYKEDKLLLTKSQEFPLENNDEEEIESKIETFKQMLKDGEI